MPVDAKLALTVTNYYAAIFFIGMCYFTDQLAAGYGIEVSEKSKIFMTFVGINGYFSMSATNTFVARIGHKKTMSLTCFANMFAFAFALLWQIKNEFIDAEAFSAKINMDANMAYFNIAQQLTLLALNYMGWVSSGSAVPTVPSFDNVSEMNMFNWSTVATCAFFGVMSFFATDSLMEMYKVSPDGAGAVMNRELMKFMGMLLIGNAVRFVCVIQAGDKKTAYANVRATIFYYLLSLGLWIFQPFAAEKMGISSEENFGPRTFDVIRSFACLMWGISVMVKND